MDFCKKIGLNIKAMEENDILQDLILSIHHSYMLTFSSTNAIKIIENQDGKAVIKGLGSQKSSISGLSTPTYKLVSVCLRQVGHLEQSLEYQILTMRLGAISQTMRAHIF